MYTAHDRSFIDKHNTATFFAFRYLSVRWQTQKRNNHFGDAKSIRLGAALDVMDSSFELGSIKGWLTGES